MTRSKHLRPFTYLVALLVCASLTASEAMAQRARLERTIQLNGRPDNQVPVVTAISIQPHGRLLATAGDDHVIRLWNLDDGRLVRELRGHTDWVTAVTFTGDGSMLLTGGRDRQVLTWDVASGRRLGQLGTHTQPITSIVTSRQLKKVAIAGFRAQLQVFDWESGKLEASLRCPCEDIRAVTFSGDMRFLAAAGRNGKIRIWNLTTGKKHDVDAHRRRISALVFTDSNELLSAGHDASIHLWNAGSGSKIGSFRNDAGKVLSMASLGANQFATASTDNLIRIYQLDEMAPQTILRGHTGSVTALAFREDRLISGSFDTTVRVWRCPSVARGAP